MAMSNALRYDAATHSYFVANGNGKERWLPGVTRVLADMGFSKGARFFTPESRQRGTAMHYAVQLTDRHAPLATTLEEVLDVIDLDPRLHGYVAGWLLFKRETGFRSIQSEFQVWSPALQVAGTVDAYGTYPDGRRVLVDLKSWASQGANPKRSAEIQTAGYALLAKESMGLETDLRVTLKLPGDNSYRAYCCENVRDAMIFRSCCSVWWERQQSGLIEKPTGQESEVEVEA